MDGVLLDRNLVVTEVELLEPSLFLDVVPEAPERFAAAIADVIPSERSRVPTAGGRMRNRASAR